MYPTVKQVSHPWRASLGAEKVEVLESGDTELMPGEILDREDVEIANSIALEASKKVSTFVPVLNGITKVNRKQ